MSIALVPVQRHRNKKTDVAKHPQVFDHVGLLVNGLPSAAGLPFIQRDLKRRTATAPTFFSGRPSAGSIANEAAAAPFSPTLRRTLPTSPYKSPTTIFTVTEAKSRTTWLAFSE